MITEDITLPQVQRLVDLIAEAIQAHLKICTLCQPGKWECPDAWMLSASRSHWQKRERAIFLSEGVSS